MDLIRLENIIHHLNCRWKLQTLSYWVGVSPLFNPASLYDGYDSVINLEVIRATSNIQDNKKRICIRHGLIDHYLQRSLMPHEAEMRTWMLGAAAHVEGKKIYIKEIIPYCQKSSTYKERRILQKEVSALCKFLRPFVLNYWNTLLQILKRELCFESYIEYCAQKKGIDYPWFYNEISSILRMTDKLYFPLMEEWSKKRYKLPLDALSRFDAINILSMEEFDPLFPENGIKYFFEFLNTWDIDLNSLIGLHLDIAPDKRKSAQAMSFIIQIPEEIYVVIRPAGGWVDIETLAHELGHGISSSYVSPELPLVDRDLATSYVLSESFAFLMQNIPISRPFLRNIMGLREEHVDTLYYYKVLKDLSIFRRYAAKFITEFEMFMNGDISDGRLYSEYMTRHTGFYYQPESHLFDLVPEFYSLDYIIAWIMEAIIEKHLKESLGEEWMFQKEAGDILKKWWKQGNSYDVFQFLERNRIGEFTIQPLIDRWERVLYGKIKKG
ncbi:MAG: hypothetical protein DRG39_00910 [Deltaproteobacteria bacterium]|nr:MAG: hypothetical protein DRG39_00910 [Deltaproteobacteria bacterium]